jgi:hypothetical protein
MIRAAVALLLSVSLLGCFPHNPKARTYAKIGEGTALLAGIAISAFVNTTADCDLDKMPGVPDGDCRSQAKWLSLTGVVLVVGGLLGFVATVSTAEEAPKPVVVPDDTAAAKPVEPSAPAAATPPPTQQQATEPAGAATGSADPGAAGSAATTPSAPQR